MVTTEPSNERTPADPQHSAVPPTDHTGMRVMGLDECLQRLAGSPVGRFAFMLDGEIAVLPVNHTVDGIDVCFCTEGGSKIQTAIDQDRVSFQVDAFDAASRYGWSVLVHGTATIVSDEAEVSRLRSISRRPWVRMNPATATWIRLSTREITGRETT